MSFTIGGNLVSNAGVRVTSGRRPQVTQNEPVLAALLDFLGGSVVGGGKPAPPGAPGAAPTPSPAVPDDLRPLLLALPIAHEGDVITPEYHNALRAVVLAMAQRLGVGTFAGTATHTFAPRFLRNAGDPEWVITQGVATRPTPTAGGNARGWFDVQLPDGTTLDSMTVRGRRTGTIEDFSVSLLRYPLVGATPEPATLIQVQLNAAANPFEESAQVDPSRISSSSGLDPLAAEVAALGFRQIDNTKYKYLISGRLSSAAAEATAQINSIQLTCRDF